MEQPSISVGKRPNSGQRVAYDALLLWFKQLAWIHADAFRHSGSCEEAPVPASVQALRELILAFGLAEFRWSELWSFMVGIGINHTLEFADLLVIKNCVIAYQNGLVKYAKKGVAPPYMSTEFAEQRDKVVARLVEQGKFKTESGGL